MKRLIAAVVALLLLGVLGLSSVASADQAPPGCNGDIKVHDGDGEPSPIEQNHPKVCGFHIHGFNFDPGANVDWRIETQPGDPGPGGTEVLSGNLTISGDGTARTGLLSLPNGMYKIYWHQDGCPGGDKHKVFKVECPPPEVCTITDTHYGSWSDWSPWSECINGEKSRSRSREVWTTDHSNPAIECSRWTETETQTESCGIPPGPTPTPKPEPPGPGRVIVGKWLWDLVSETQKPEAAWFEVGTAKKQTSLIDGRNEFILSTVDKNEHMVRLTRPTNDPNYVRCWILPEKGKPGYWREWKPGEDVLVTFWVSEGSESRLECVNIPPQPIPPAPTTVPEMPKELPKMGGLPIAVDQAAAGAILLGILSMGTGVALRRLKA